MAVHGWARRMAPGLAAAILFGLAATATSAETSLRIAAPGDLGILDPHFSGDPVARDHALLVYDTLFARDAAGRMQAQMVELWSASVDRRVWTFSLRAGLRFSDGTEVTAQDCVASLRRWMARDPLGGLMARALARIEARDDRTIVMTFAQPFGPVLEALGKTLGPIPAILPARLANTPSSTPLREATGSGPYIFDARGSGPGVALYRRSPVYVGRGETTDGLSGDRRGAADRIERRSFVDPIDAMAALIDGEIDVVADMPLDLVDIIAATPGLRIDRGAGRTRLAALRINPASESLTSIEARRALALAVDAEALFPALYPVDAGTARCPATGVCWAPRAERDPADALVSARILFTRSGVAGPLVVAAPSDGGPLASLSAAVADRLRGLNVPVEVRREAYPRIAAMQGAGVGPRQGGFALSVEQLAPADPRDPALAALLWAAADGLASGPETEALRAAIASAQDQDSVRKALAAGLMLAREGGGLVPIGALPMATAWREGVTGLILDPIPLYWKARPPQ